MKPYIQKHPLYERLRHLRGAVIIVEGIIGAGKTSLGKALVDLLNTAGLEAKFYEEEVNHPLLELFLSDMPKYAFAFQMYMLQNRQKIYREAMDYTSRHNGIAIVDRSQHGDIAFAMLANDYGNISDQEWMVYESTINSRRLLAPSAILYLDVTADVAMKRIHRRDRGSEGSAYTLKYLEDLDMNYKVAMEESDIPIKYLDWNMDRTIDTDLLTELCDLLDPR